MKAGPGIPGPAFYSADLQSRCGPTLCLRAGGALASSHTGDSRRPSEGGVPGAAACAACGPASATIPDQSSPRAPDGPGIPPSSLVVGPCVMQGLPAGAADRRPVSGGWLLPRGTLSAVRVGGQDLLHPLKEEQKAALPVPRKAREVAQELVVHGCLVLFVDLPQCAHSRVSRGLEKLVGIDVHRLRNAKQHRRRGVLYLAVLELREVALAHRGTRGQLSLRQPTFLTELPDLIAELHNHTSLRGSRRLSILPHLLVNTTVSRISNLLCFRSYLAATFRPAAAVATWLRTGVASVRGSASAGRLPPSMPSSTFSRCAWCSLGMRARNRRRSGSTSTAYPSSIGPASADSPYPAACMSTRGSTCSARAKPKITAALGFCTSSFSSCER